MTETIAKSDVEMSKSKLVIQQLIVTLSEAYSQYIRSSHNLCQEDKWERYREKIVYKGAMAIAVALSQLPTTEHDKNSFLLEFITVRQNILIFTLRGIMRDGIDVDNPSGAVKFFTRTFIVVPRGEE
jgi:hypothetical protein